MKIDSYAVPAFIEDLPHGSAESAALANRWTINVTGWLAQAMPAAPSYFYAPAGIDIPSSATAARVDWSAFPGRLDQFYSASPPNNPANPSPLTADQIFSLADTGYYIDGQNNRVSFPEIPETLCPQADWDGALRTFGPYGPRGWLDEYCEWSTVRNADDQLVRIDFACENPEYWATLWKVSPETVCALYTSTLNTGAPAENHVVVTLVDLQLVDAKGNAVIDPDTGRPAYNPLNKWNCGPIATRGSSAASGGVMHLTSTPNTLQTELGLAGGSTPQFPGSGPQALICCGNYGQEYRHSDPHIGATVNYVVSKQMRVSLANPVGLYLQLPPDMSIFKFAPHVEVGKTVPSGAKASDIYQILRGSAVVTDQVTGAPFDGNMVLHAACQIPTSWLEMTPSLTLNDILVQGTPLQWAGQIANNFKVALFARPLPAVSKAPAVQCADPTPTPGSPLQCLWGPIFDAMVEIAEDAPTGMTMPLVSNSTFIAPWVPNNATTARLALTCNLTTEALTVEVLLPDGSAPDPTISVTTTATNTTTYAIPGNSYPGTYTSLQLDVTVPAGATTGLRTVQVTAGDNAMQLPAALYVTSASAAQPVKK